MSTFLQSLDDLWKAGRLRELERDLDRFILDHLGEIRREMKDGRASGLAVARRRFTRGEITNRQLVDFCVRTVLRRRGTCNARRDIEEQKGEIEREVWYEGERRRAPVPSRRREEIARSWAREHSAEWREWRIYQLLYVWNKKVDQYVGIIAQKK